MTQRMRLRGTSEWTHPVVWLVEEKYRRSQGVLVYAHDTSKAEAYGTRRRILDGRLRPWETDAIAAAVNRSFAPQYNPRIDYIMLIGSPTTISIVMPIAAAKAKMCGVQTIMELYYHRREDDYRMVLIDIDKLAYFSQLRIDPAWLEASPA